jgi:hypothetical protein
LIESAILLLYNLLLVLLYDTPELLRASIHSKGCTPMQVAVVYCALTAVNALHAGSFFHCLGTFGAVGSAAMKGLQALSVFFLSSIFFCQYSQLQCATLPKAMSMAVVFSGLFIYASGAAARHGAANPSTNAGQIEMEEQDVVTAGLLSGDASDNGAAGIAGM